jgi:uncharacterized protein (DUF58 family)
VGSVFAGRRRNEGYEFADLRAYAPGDDPRRIDWAATARSGELQVRVCYETRGAVFAVALDSSRSMRVGRLQSAYEDASAAARSWFSLATNEDRILWIVGGGAILSGRHARESLRLENDPVESSLSALVSVALARLPRDCGLLLVSDFFELDACADELAVLSRKVDVTALIAGDPWRGLLSLDGAVTFIDAESDARQRVVVRAEERQRYHAAVAQRERELFTRLRTIGTRTALLDAEDPVRSLGEALGLWR